MKKILVTSIILILLISTLSGCSTKNNDKIKEVNISYVKLPLNIPSIIEKNKNLFEEEFNKDGIEVVFSEITQGSKMTQALAAGSLDFCNALGGTSAILAAANGVDIKIIGTYSRAPKAFTIMSNDESINSIKDLKGKKIVGPKGTILHQLLLSALVENEMSLDDVKFINMGIAEGIAALSSGNVDAALVAGPAVTTALQAGSKIITTGEGMLDATIVIATSGELINKNPEIINKYMQVHKKSLDYMNQNPEDTFQIAAVETNIPVEDVKTMFEWYDFNPEITSKDIEELEKTQDFLFENGMLENKMNISDMIVDMSK